MKLGPIFVKSRGKGRRVGNDLILPIYREVEHRVRRIRGSRAMWPNACAGFGSNPGSVKIFAQTLFCRVNLLWFQGYLLAGEMGRGFVVVRSQLWNTKNLQQPLYLHPSASSSPPIWELNCVKSSQANLSRQIPKYWIVIHPS